MKKEWRRYVRKLGLNGSKVRIRRYKRIAELFATLGKYKKPRLRNMAKALDVLRPCNLLLAEMCNRCGGLDGEVWQKNGLAGKD